MQRRWPSNQVKVVGFVDSQRFVDVTVRVDVRSHGAVQRQAAERERERERGRWKMCEFSKLLSEIKHRKS